MNYKETMVNPKFKVLFTKKDGSDRLIECTVDPKYCDHTSGKEEYLVVFDLEKQDYRTVNTNTIKIFERM